MLTVVGSETTAMTSTNYGSATGSATYRVKGRASVGMEPTVLSGPSRILLLHQLL